MISHLYRAAAVILFTLAVPASVLTAEPRWTRAESPNFVVFTDTGEADARAYIRTLEQFDAVLRMRHGIGAEPARRKLPVYLLRRRGDLREIWPTLKTGTAGFYSSGPEDTFAVASEGRASDAVLLHEYVHHFMLQHYPYGYPSWLVEGYAEYFMTFRTASGYVEVGNYDKNRASWLSGGDWIGFDRVLKASPRDLSGNQVAMFYAQSWALTHWFLSDPARSRQLESYIEAVGNGVDPVKAMKDITGLGPSGLARTIRNYLARGFPYQRITLKDLPNPAVTVTSLTPAASDVILVNLRVLGDNGVDAPEDRTDGPVLLKAVRSAAKPHGGDRLADLVLARGEAKLGDQAEAERILERLLRTNPNDIEALQVLADLKLKQAESAAPDAAAKLRNEARALAGRAHKADPNNYQTLIAYARGREEVPGYPNKNDLNVLLDALDLAPQVAPVRINAAKALIRHERYADAAAVLEMLVANPHGGEAAGEARKLLEVMRAAGQLRPEAPAAAEAES